MISNSDFEKLWFLYKTEGELVKNLLQTRKLEETTGGRANDNDNYGSLRSESQENL